MFTSVLFTIAKTWKQLKLFIHSCLSIKKEGHPAIHNNMDGTWRHLTKWNKSDKDKYCMISLICGILKKKKNSQKRKSDLLSERQREGFRNSMKVDKRYKLSGSSHHATVETNLTSIHEDEGLIPDLAQWVKNPVLLWAVVQVADVAQVLRCCGCGVGQWL